jgi:hypothetical protein
MRKWEKYEIKPFKTEKQQLVCCLNTMGQDRKFTADEKLFALRTVQRFRDRWEQSDRENLKQDIERRIRQMEMDKQYREQFEAQDNQELESRLEAFRKGLDEELSEEQRDQAV